MGSGNKQEVSRQAEPRSERTEPFRPSLCERCANKYRDYNIKDGICGTCADDLRGEAEEA